LLRATYIKASTLAITLPVIGSKIIFKEIGYFENSIISSSLRRQALYSLRYLYKFQAWKKKMVTVIPVVLQVALWVSIAAVNRRPAT
jgi:hypothetical protein